MIESGAQLPDRLLHQLRRWGALWGIPGLSKKVTISYSSRLSRTLARCRPLKAHIALRSDLIGAPYPLLEEIVCHEFAHLATYKLYGLKAKPHGKQWRELMCKVGYEPRIRIQAPSFPGHLRNQRISSPLFEHRCPVCQAVRIARRPVTNWRCAHCLDAGLEGAMDITRRTDLVANRRDH